MAIQLPAPKGRLSAKRDGFALLITVTLLAFVVVLLVGLAMFTRVETSVAGNSQRQAQARENALLALNVALGQLQKYAGPDRRVTATADALPHSTATTHYTGVWDATTTDAAPLTWLVSGNELNDSDGKPAPLAVKPTTTVNTTTGVALVGANTTRTTNDVLARLMPITSTIVPGSTGTTATTVGRYAWWVGDQGVKAPVAMPDTVNAVTFAPYDTDEPRARLRQQLATGAGAAAASDGTPVFEPKDSNNANLVANQKVTAATQMAFLRTAANAQLGLTRVQQNYHAWSPNNFAVLANTKDGGLRQDLSLKPDLLGVPFAAWANYAGYMETPGAAAADSTVPAILPGYGTSPLRRRYVMTPHIRTGNTGGSHQVGPILSYFELRFHVGTEDGSSARDTALELRAAWRISFWNPYTAALVPEDLRIEVSGLPRSVQIWNEGDPQAANPVLPQRIGTFSLRSNSDPASLGSPLRIGLPWNRTDLPADATGEDRQSWLPGRVYTWRSIEDTTKGAVPADGYPSRFYTRSYVLDGAGKGETNQGVQRPIQGITANGSEKYHLQVDEPTNLTVTLSVIRNGTPIQLATFTSPEFLAFSTTPDEMGGGSYQFGYVFRLKEGVDTIDNPSDWLTNSVDFRRSRVPPEAFVTGAQGNRPELYAANIQSFEISAPDRLLDRDSLSYDEDVPVFELPRSPILSMGSLQHFRIVGSRPLIIGNPWGFDRTLNGIPLLALFDRFFFSGITADMTPGRTSAGDLILPNALLKPLRNADGTKVTVDDVRATSTVAAPPADTTVTDDSSPEVPPTATTATDQVDARSSKFFLQAGAFNLNSTNATAWTSVLRGLRFPAPTAFNYLDAATTTGTADDGSIASVQSSDAQFFRFPQSAQETYKAGLLTPPTHLFRKGMRTLTGPQVSALAAKIVANVSAKIVDSGPFRSLEEFLSPSALFAGTDTAGNAGASRSLLEAAIADAGINNDIAEFSSQWLTQADVMTTLAPLLFPRSDTFVIRTYGEVVNPATSATEGRAWAEAIVQRVPEYFADPANNPPEKAPADFEHAKPTATDTLNKLLGRRFKVLSFRWLTRSDI